MPQLQLPIFPEGVTLITNEIAFQCKDGIVTYFYGHLPVFQHGKEDLKCFRIFLPASWLSMVVFGKQTSCALLPFRELPLTQLPHCFDQFGGIVSVSPWFSSKDRSGFENSD